MGHSAFAVIAGGILATSVALAQSDAPTPISPDSVRWFQAPMPGVEGAWFIGGEDRAGSYVFRVKLAQGARIPPHTHPDERSTTVLSGTIYVGFGEVFEEAKVVAIPAGSMYVAPARTPHYVWARDGAAIYQETGIGPSGTTPVRR